MFAEANSASAKSEYVLQVLSTTRDQALASTAGLSVTSQHYYQDFEGRLTPCWWLVGAEPCGRTTRMFSAGFCETGTYPSFWFCVYRSVSACRHRAFRRAKGSDALAKLPPTVAGVPKIDVQSDPIFVKDGPFYSSAGVTAGIDLCLALIEEDLGIRIAGLVARVLVLYLRRPGGQAQFSDLIAESSMGTDESLRDLPAWVRGRMARDLSVEVLARQVSMSPRTFARRFTAASRRHQPPGCGRCGQKQPKQCCRSLVPRSPWWQNDAVSEALLLSGTNSSSDLGLRQRST